jgi:hypothetical protein
VPDFSTPAAIFARARQLFDDPEARARRVWEAKFGQPSDGNPAFERLTLQEHSARMICDKFIAQGYPEDAPTAPGEDDISRKIATAAAEGKNPFAEIEAEYEDALAVTGEEDED